jgi:lipopolysaccharide export system ATP-binding protein
MRHSLRAANLSKNYDGKRVVNDVSLNVQSGEIVGLLGPNGAGKTTTFYIITGMIMPDEGAITLDGEEIGSLPMYIRSLKGLGYLPQEPSIFRKLNVRDNLRAVLEIRGLPQSEIDSRIEKILGEFDLSGFADRERFRRKGQLKALKGREAQGRTRALHSHGAKVHPF